MTAADILVSPEEIAVLTGYARAHEQVAELHRLGYFRARRNRLGRVILERPHFRAIQAQGPSAPIVNIAGSYTYRSFYANSARRAAAIEMRTPLWADREAIEAIYAEARRVSAETGIPHHVDHEIPLQGRLVSGLHVAHNLRVLPADENVRKSNHFKVE